MDRKVTRSRIPPILVISVICASVAVIVVAVLAYTNSQRKELDEMKTQIEKTSNELEYERKRKTDEATANAMREEMRKKREEGLFPCPDCLTSGKFIDIRIKPEDQVTCKKCSGSGWIYDEKLDPRRKPD